MYRSMSEPQEKGAKWLVMLSLAAPLIAGGLRWLLPEPEGEVTRVVVGGTSTLLILAGLALGGIALRDALRGEGKGIVRGAYAGLAVNGLCLLGFVVLLPALRHVALAHSGRLTTEQMAQLPDILPESRAILDEGLGFRMEVPRDFVDNLEAQTGNMLHSFVCLGPVNPGLVINVERLGGQLARGRIDREFYAALRMTLPADAYIERATMPWKGHQLDVFGMHFSMDGREVCAWSVQVPLAKEAIQISVAGPARSNAACRKLLGMVLSGVQGISNWGEGSARTSSRF